jgi:hypothetical protein
MEALGVRARRRLYARSLTIRPDKKLPAASFVCRVEQQLRKCFVIGQIRDGQQAQS